MIRPPSLSVMSPLPHPPSMEQSMNMPSQHGSSPEMAARDTTSPPAVKKEHTNGECSTKAEMHQTSSAVDAAAAGNEHVNKNDGPPSALNSFIKYFRAQIMGPLFKNQKTLAFRKPVDAVALGIYPIYFDVIKEPMDLGTIRQKLDAGGTYKTREEIVYDLNLVWTNAMTFNRPGDVYHETAKILKYFCDMKLEDYGKSQTESSSSLLVSLFPENLATNRAKRVVRKVSRDLPEEASRRPQHLHKKYVKALPNGLRSCDAILKELMTLKVHKEYVEPFMHIERNPAVHGDHVPMDLFTIQEKLQSGDYVTPHSFADDIRTVIREAHEYTGSNMEIIAAANNLQNHFEALFAKVSHPTTNGHFPPSIPGPSTSSLSFGMAAPTPTMNGLLVPKKESRKELNSDEEDDRFLGQLIAAQQQMESISKNLSLLIKDFKGKGKSISGKRKASRAKRSSIAAPPATPVLMNGYHSSAPLAATPDIPRPMAAVQPFVPVEATPPPAKKKRTTVKKTPKVSKKLQRHNLSQDQCMALREQIGKLAKRNQMQVIAIMQDNNEVVDTDESGYMEIDFWRCSLKTIEEIHGFLDSLEEKKIRRKVLKSRKKEEEQRLAEERERRDQLELQTTVDVENHASPKKQKSPAKKQERLSDSESSSGSSSSSSSSSGSSSSSSSSSSEEDN